VLSSFGTPFTVSHGPFAGGSNEDILRLYNEYTEGKTKPISTVEEEGRVTS